MMKKYLPLFAVLVLAGCAHSGYRTSYLEEYAGYDCFELQAERLAVEDELGSKWVKRLVADNTMSNALFFSDAFEIPGGLALPGVDDYDPSAQRRNKKRMRNHAKWQALAQLEQTKGCRHDASRPPTPHE